MVNVFLDAYTLTEPSTRKSFEKLLHTWKNGMPGGAPVFPRHIIEKIERSVQYIREKTPSTRYQPSSNQQIHVNPNFVAKVRYFCYYFSHYSITIIIIIIIIVPIYVMRDLLFLFCIFVCVYVCICLFVCVYIYICIYICVCIYVEIK
jgi:hypothetical protein